MPTYQYKREDGTIFEMMQKISDDALKTCPQSGQKVTRVISGGAGVVYKGDGWYVTDYKNKSNENSSSNGNGSPCCSNSSCCSTSTPESKTKTEASG